MSIDKPQVSVVIPVFNRQNVVLETLESLKLQSCLNWECILVDDYSTDKSVDVIKTYIKDDNRFTLICKTNEKKGAPVARNIGWQNANSSYIVFLDSDDLLTPSALQKRVNHLSENKDLDFNLSCNVEFKENTNHKRLRVIYNSQDPMKSFLSFNAVWQTSSPTWKKDFLEKVNGWDEEAMSWQDGEIHIRALLLKPKFEWIDEIPNVFLRTSNGKSISHQKSIKKYLNNVVIFSKILKKLDDNQKQLFSENIKIWVYNLVEKLSYEEAIRFSKKAEINDFNITKIKLLNYLKLYHFFKNIYGIRYLIFQLREKTNIFSRRKKFFVKNEISFSIQNELKNELSKILLFTKNVSWLSE